MITAIITRMSKADTVINVCLPTTTTSSIFLRHNGHEYPLPHDHDNATVPDHDFSHSHEPVLTRPNTPSKYSRDELYAIVSQVGEGTLGRFTKRVILSTGCMWL
jgi:hypothetical protein